MVSERRIAGQGERCVVAFNAAGQWGEVIGSEGDICPLLLVDGHESFIKKTEIVNAMQALKLIKPNGAVAYLCEGKPTLKNPSGYVVCTANGVFG